MQKTFFSARLSINFKFQTFGWFMNKIKDKWPPQLVLKILMHTVGIFCFSGTTSARLLLLSFGFFDIIIKINKIREISTIIVSQFTKKVLKLGISETLYLHPTLHQITPQVIYIILKDLCTQSKTKLCKFFFLGSPHISVALSKLNLRFLVHALIVKKFFSS